MFSVLRNLSFPFLSYRVTHIYKVPVSLGFSSLVVLCFVRSVRYSLRSSYKLFSSILPPKSISKYTNLSLNLVNVYYNILNKEKRIENVSINF